VDHSQAWHDLYQHNVGVIGSNPDLILPGQVLVTSGAAHAGPAAAHAAPAAPAPPAAAAHAAPAAPAAPAPAAAAHAAPAAPAPAAATAVAHITNSAGNVKPQSQAAADAVVSHVPGAAGITIGGTRPDSVDPKGHPAGLALDYMVLSDTALGHAIVQYTVAHWNELHVSYVIYQQKILTSPTGAWEQMPDRGSPTANHMDHVHVSYVG
jgi:hypothetical protein